MHNLRFFFFLVSTLGWGQTLTLEQALREALAQHPLLDVSSARITSFEGKTQQAALRPNPLFVYQTEDFRVWDQPRHRFWQDADHFLYLQQTFETASKRARRTDVAMAQQRRAEIELLQQKQSIAARVRSAFWDAAGAQARLAMYQQAERELEIIVQYHRDQAKEGLRAEADLLRVELELQKLDFLAAQAAFDSQREQIRLQREMGRTEIQELSVEADLERPARTPLPENWERARAMRADAQLASQIVLLANAQIALENSLSRPNLDGIAGYKRSRTFDTVIWGVQMPLPVFNRNQGNIASATAEQRLARSAETATLAILRAEVAAAEAELSARQRQWEAYAKPLRERTQFLLDLAQQAYRLGGADLLRLLDAQRNMLELRQLHLDALIALRQAEANLESVLGVLP